MKDEFDYVIGILEECYKKLDEASYTKLNIDVGYSDYAIDLRDQLQSAIEVLKREGNK